MAFFHCDKYKLLTHNPTIMSPHNVPLHHSTTGIESWGGAAVLVFACSQSQFHSTMRSSYLTMPWARMALYLTRLFQWSWYVTQIHDFNLKTTWIHSYLAPYLAGCISLAQSHCVWFFVNGVKVNSDSVRDPDFIRPCISTSNGASRVVRFARNVQFCEGRCCQTKYEISLMKSVRI